MQWYDDVQYRSKITIKKIKMVPSYGTVVLGELDETDLKRHGAHCQDIYDLKV